MITEELLKKAFIEGILVYNEMLDSEDLDSLWKESEAYKEYSFSKVTVDDTVKSYTLFEGLGNTCLGSCFKKGKA